MYWLLLIWVLHFAVVCSGFSEHHCIYDIVNKPSPGASVKQLPSGIVDKLRIKYFTSLLKESTLYCTKAGETKQSRVCTKDDVFTTSKKSILLKIIPAAIKLHTDRLMVRRLSGPILLKKQPETFCSSLPLPEEYFSTGISDADLALFIAVQPITLRLATFFTVAAPCAWGSDGRPTAGVIFFDAQSIAHTDQLIRVTAHEIAHLLGFDNGQMHKRKLTFHAKNGVSPESEADLVSSTKLMAHAGKHFGCSSMKGMPLEFKNAVEGFYSYSHWGRQVAKDELMSPIVTTGYYTALTMALFEDLGYFKADYSLAEPMGWGNKAGCEFFKETCANKGKLFPDMYCNDTFSPFSCTSDRLAIGSCDIAHIPAVDQSNDENPASKNLMVSPLLSSTDNCPVIRAFKTTGCLDGLPQDMPGSLIGPASRCFKGESLTTKSEFVGDVCANVKCVKKKVFVQYAGNSSWHECTNYGEKIQVYGKVFTGGSIICPRYMDVCSIPPSMTSEIGLNQTDGSLPYLSISLATYWATFVAVLLVVV